jgi:gas vesicle protein
LSFFIVGGLAGAALGLLLAPNSGEGTRRLLGSRLRELLGDEEMTEGEKGEVIFSNRPEPAADADEPLLRGETLTES